MKRYKIINKTRFYTFVVVVVCISFSVFSFFKSFSKAEDISSGKAEDISSNLIYREVYVQAGDTIWSIASSNRPVKSDPRDMVAEIRSFNDLDDLIIKPGDIIKIPSRKK